DAIAISDSANNVGWDALVSGDADRAAPYLEEALEIARNLNDTFRMTLAVNNLAHVAVVREQYVEAVELNREGLLLCISRGDKRGGSEVLLSLSAALAGLGHDVLSVKLDAMHLAVGGEAGLVDWPELLQLFKPLLEGARSRLGPDRV